MSLWGGEAVLMWMDILSCRFATVTVLVGVESWDIPAKETSVSVPPQCSSAGMTWAASQFRASVALACSGA